MPDLIPFQFDSKEIRVLIHENGEPWWVLADACAILGLGNPAEVARRLDPGNVDTLSFSEGIVGNPTRLIVNEPGLYELIFRSNKPAAKTFRQWVFSDVLPQIRKTGKYEPAKPPTRLEDLDFTERCATFLQRIGAFEERDKLMVADKVRTLLLSDTGTPKTLPAPQGFFLSERIHQLGYQLTRSQEAKLMSQGLARQVASEYRKRHSAEPIQSQRFVDGAVRPVFWYRQEEAEWIDVLIQKACAKMGVSREETHI